jgi:hypothetical protein
MSKTCAISFNRTDKPTRNLARSIEVFESLSVNSRRTNAANESITINFKLFKTILHSTLLIL